MTHPPVPQSPPCSHESVLLVSGQCKDTCWIRWPNGRDTEGYVPDLPGIRGPSGSDYIEIRVCMACSCVLDFDPTEMLAEMGELGVNVG